MRPPVIGTSPVTGCLSLLQILTTNVVELFSLCYFGRNISCRTTANTLPKPEFHLQLPMRDLIPGPHDPKSGALTTRPSEHFWNGYTSKGNNSVNYPQSHWKLLLKVGICSQRLLGSNSFKSNPHVWTVSDTREAIFGLQKLSQFFKRVPNSFSISIHHQPERDFWK